ncbi:hypothetical protein ACH5RR_041523 [Cinchona calisaya]|uniref:Uncharacterized protein n=1 Tax=Cinchona calisaya TaxID=153742 RepID=A0ABD2XWD2_9GENT
MREMKCILTINGAPKICSGISNKLDEHESCYQCPYYPIWLKAEEEQSKSAAPLPWIGLYIAVASAVCLIAVAADAVQGSMSRNAGFHANILRSMQLL